MIEDYSNAKKDISLVIFIIIVVAFGLFLATSCKTIQPLPVSDTVRIENTVIQIDSFSYTETDSILISLLFECDSNNNVLIKALNEAQTKGFRTKYIFKDNRLDLTAYIDSMAILHKLINDTKSKEVIKQNPMDAVLYAENVQEIEINTPVRNGITGKYEN